MYIEIYFFFAIDSFNLITRTDHNDCVIRILEDETDSGLYLVG